MAAIASAPASTAMRRAATSRSGDQRVEHVDRAELLHGARPLEPEAGGGGDVVGLLEGGLRGVEVAPALGPPDHLERLALHGRLARCARAPSRAARARATATSGSDATHRGLGGQRVGAGQAGRVAGGQRCGCRRRGPRRRPTGRRPGRRRRARGGPRPARRDRCSSASSSVPSAAARAVWPGLRAGPQQHQVGGVPRGRRSPVSRARVARASAEAREPSSRARSGGLAATGRRPGRRWPAAVGELGGERAPLTGQVGIGGEERVEGPAGQRRPARWGGRRPARRHG